MLSGRVYLRTNIFVRYASQDWYKRFMQTAPHSVRRTQTNLGSFNYQLNTDMSSVQQQEKLNNNKWARHSLTFPTATENKTQDNASKSNDSNQSHITVALPPNQPVRRSRTSRFRHTAKPQEAQEQKVSTTKGDKTDTIEKENTQAPENKESVIAEAPLPKVKTEKTALGAAEPAKTKKPRRQLRPRKALITLSSAAVEHLRALLDQPNPQLIRIGVKNRGCSGLTYHLEYVTEPGKFDETVEQDGVKVLIDSKALFSIVGSEMDWLDDKLSSRFIFKNPNSKGTCGCGESFMV